MKADDRSNAGTHEAREVDCLGHCTGSESEASISYCLAWINSACYLKRINGHLNCLPMSLSSHHISSPLATLSILLMMTEEELQKASLRSLRSNPSVLFD